jgi:hypothetical protein
MSPGPAAVQAGSEAQIQGFALFWQFRTERPRVPAGMLGGGVTQTLE